MLQTGGITTPDRQNRHNRQCSGPLSAVFGSGERNRQNRPNRQAVKRYTSGKEKAHKHKQIFPVTARAAGGLPTGWGGVSRPVARGQKFMCCVRNPRNINVFVRVPGREESGSRPGGSVTGVTEKLFMCQMFMCLFRPLTPPQDHNPLPPFFAAFESFSSWQTLFLGRHS